MHNRTYRYFKGQPLFAFGHGLSYSQFDYTKARFNDSSFKADDTIDLSFNLKNRGKFDGDEVAQVYFRHKGSAVSQPRLALCGFTRIQLKRGKTSNVTFHIPVERMRFWDTSKKQYIVEPGDYELLIGAASDDIRLHVPFRIVSQ